MSVPLRRGCDLVLISCIATTVHVHEDKYAGIDTGWRTFEITAHVHGYVDGVTLDALNNALVFAFDDLGSLTGNTYTKGQKWYRG